jgi:hypothetical protein
MRYAALEGSSKFDKNSILISCIDTQNKLKIIKFLTELRHRN